MGQVGDVSGVSGDISDDDNDGIGDEMSEACRFARPSAAPRETVEKRERNRR